MTNQQTIDYISEIVSKHPLTYSIILFSKDNKDVSKYILEHTVFLNGIKNISKKTRIHCILNNITALPKCKICGKTIERNINNHTHKFAVYCSPKCENSDEEVISKLNDTCLKKYGCKWSIQSVNNKTKTRDTMLRKYGVEYAQQNVDIKNRSLSTMKQKYGSEYPLRNNEILLKAIRSARIDSYDRFLSNDVIKPMFSREEYVKCGNDFDYLWKCSRCNTIFQSNVNMSWFKQGQDRTYARCTHCFPYEIMSSSGEKDIFMFIKSVYNGNIVLNDRCLSSEDVGETQTSHKMEIDINIVDKLIGFEYDGLYYHSERNGKGKKYHLMKTQMAEKQGIHLIHILESEWMLKRDIVKSRIKNILGVFDTVVYARKCLIRIVDSKTAESFINRCHIQGYCTSSLNIGLFFNDNLISIMSFSKSRYDKKYEWELVRFCNELGCHVIGGAGKLLKFFERNYNPKSLISYADRRWSRGNLYYKLGFTFLRNSPPNYWYFKNIHLESRQKFQKHKLSMMLDNYDDSKTEWENMFNNGYNRIFDCGNMVFVKTY